MTDRGTDAVAAAALRVVVVGGGISGLATGWYLQRLLGPRATVRVLESGTRAGGKVTTRPVAGLPVDTGPDAFLSRAPELRALIEDLGLAADVVGPSASGAYVWSRGRMRRLPAGAMFGVPDRLVPLLRSGLLSPLGTLRAGLDLVRPATRLPEDPSVGQIVRPRFGGEVFDRLVEPLLGGVHAGSADQLSARSSVPEIAALAAPPTRSLFLSLRRRRKATEAAAAGAPRTPPLVSLRGGMSGLTGALADALGDAVRTGAEVTTLTRTDDHYAIATTGETVEADVVVLATPAHVSASLLAGLAPELAEVLREIPYVGVANVTLAIPRSVMPELPPDGTGFLVPPIEGELVVGCSWLTSKWPHLANDDVALLRCLVGRQGDDRWTLLDDASLVTAVRADLVRMLGLTAAPVETLVQRWPAAMPQYTVGHADRLTRIDAALARLGGLHLTGAAYRGVGLAGCVAQAHSLADRIADAVETDDTAADLTLDHAGADALVLPEGAAR
jgi:oxygen-dependent protoporphyrinogen oxidase